MVQKAFNRSLNALVSIFSEQYCLQLMFSVTCLPMRIKIISVRRTPSPLLSLGVFLFLHRFRHRGFHLPLKFASVRRAVAALISHINSV